MHLGYQEDGNVLNGSMAIRMIKDSIYKHYQPAIGLVRPDATYGTWFIFKSGEVLVKSGETAEIPLMDPIENGVTGISSYGYLGIWMEHPCFWAEASEGCPVAPGYSFEVRRPLFGQIPDDVYLLMGKAYQMMYFNRTTKYCGVCSGEMHSQGDGARKCSSCGHTQYPQIAPATITAIIKGDRILLAHNKNFQGRIHSLIAGFLEAGETFEECVHREVLEEVGIKVKNIRYTGSQPWPYPNSLMVGFMADYESGEIQPDGEEIMEADWFTKDDLPELPHRGSIARSIIEAWLQG